MAERRKPEFDPKTDAERIAARARYAAKEAAVQLALDGPRRGANDDRKPAMARRQAE